MASSKRPVRASAGDSGSDDEQLKRKVKVKMRRGEVVIGGALYREERIREWTREQLQPVSRQAAIESGVGIDRSWLFTKGREVHLDFIFSNPQASFLGKDGKMIRFDGCEVDAFAPVNQKEEKPVKAGDNGEGHLVDVLAEVLKGRIGGSGLDEAAIKAQVDGRVSEYLKGTVKRFEIVFPDGRKEVTELSHKQLGDLLLFLGIRQHCALIGPAASFKTHSVEQAATQLGLKFFAMSMGPQTMQSDILGYKDANGRYVLTQVREAFEFGGVILLDEMDAASEDVGVCINAMTANAFCGFPDKVVKRHEDFVMVLCMNTYGRGMDRIYVGRGELDGATVDRFAFLSWEYDEPLEMALCSDKAWCGYVQKVRAAVLKTELRYLVTPRASFGGAKALGAGMDRLTVEEAFIWKGMSQEERSKVNAAMRS